MIATIDRTPLPRSVFRRPVLEAAPDLRGGPLVRMIPEGPVALRLTEAEARDAGNDPGPHACRDRATRSGVMSGPPGQAHVRFIHGMSRRSA
ncbi:hypothetical protein GCM10010269_75670 [Streptomyces humidus]|uniref:Uncharacterized protein n=1 Tax=Streptomyces humidus TaxID=52259 RepID=A0A918GAM4_9ACTN|nr:DNA-3-methyladenine glycosylase [Streptomyces humidus]GGS25888.1 hypothetical protein GCM10010269_75670 [Streptomyces humidus]